MFAHEEHWGTDHPFAFMIMYVETEAACFHEAGHAVVGYILGLGCTGLSVHINVKDSATSPKFAVGGVAYKTKTATLRVNSQLRKGTYAPILRDQGITTCAGPAAERRYRYQSEVPMRLLLAAQGDHAAVDVIAKRLELNRRNRFAFQRLTWRLAQKLVEVDRVWAAISDLASALREVAPEPETDGTESGSLSGTNAKFIMRRCGVFPVDDIREALAW